MSVRSATHPNGFTEIIGERTPSQQAEWFSRRNRVSKFPLANYRSSEKPSDQPLPKVQDD